MDNHQMHDRDRDVDELGRRLEAYAEGRLSPELSATTRMRARVMAAAHHQAMLARADTARAALAAAAAEAQADRTRRMSWRRPLTALLAAGLTLGVGVGSVAAAQAGGPLYGARVWAETLTLPPNANERAQAELHRLADRLAEAAAATTAGDLNAANAALDAYAAIVNEATAGAGNDVSAAATLEKGVQSNIGVLTVLVQRMTERGNDQAAESIQRALERAIEKSDSAVDKLHGKPVDTPGNGPAATPTKKPKPAGEPQKTANPNKPTPDPVGATPKPHPTPQPHPTPKGDATDDSVATPRPEHTPRGGGGGNGGGGGGGNGGDTGGNGQAD